MTANALLQRPRHLEDINNQILFKLRAYKICLVELKANLSNQSGEEDLELQNKR